VILIYRLQVSVLCEGRSQELQAPYSALVPEIEENPNCCSTCLV